MSDGEVSRNSWDGYEIFFFQAEDGKRDVERSRELGDVYKSQVSKPSSVSTTTSNLTKLGSMRLNGSIGPGLRTRDRTMLRRTCASVSYTHLTLPTTPYV